MTGFESGVFHDSSSAWAERGRGVSSPRVQQVIPPSAEELSTIRSPESRVWLRSARRCTRCRSSCHSAIAAHTATSRSSPASRSSRVQSLS